MSTDQKPFWETKALGDMSREEWESLCDGCAKCCLHKLEDADTGEILQTNVACRLLDMSCAQCTRYADRKRLVPDCVVLDPDNVHELNWMPNTCAYRLLAEGTGELLETLEFDPEEQPTTEEATSDNQPE